MDNDRECEACDNKHNDETVCDIHDNNNYNSDYDDGENHNYDEENHDEEEYDEENYTNDGEYEEENNYSEGDDVVTDDGEEEESEGEWESNFHKFYNVYPLSYLEITRLEAGNKIIMPQSALGELIDGGVEFPMLFKIENPSKGKTSHCGVMEFSAEEGVVFMPEWMMRNMSLNDGELINLKNVNLDTATYVKLQPHSVEFLEILNPKEVLESAFCLGYACLTVGDTIIVMHEGKKLYVDIIEALPSNAVCVIETDVEVDFACPLDYKESVSKPEKKQELPNTEQHELSEKEKNEVTKFVPFTGKGRRLNETNKDGTTMSNISIKPSEASLETSKSMHSEEILETSKNSSKPFKPFTGKKYSLMD